MLSNVLQDIRYAMRRLAASPGFTAAAIVTIALGVGANAAIFGVAKSVLLDALPYADADRLVRVYGGLRDEVRSRGPLTAGAVAEIAARQRSFASMAAFGSLAGDAVFGGGQGARVAKVAWVQPSFFDTLRVAAAQGRTLREEDATSGLVPMSGGALADDTATSVVISHDAWKRLFVGDPAVVGREAIVSGQPRTVVGVLPEGFIGPAGDADFYFAFDITPVAARPIAAHRSGWLGLVGRLKPGVGEAVAASELETVWTQLKRDHPEEITQTLSPVPLRDALVGDTRTPLIVLLASAGFVLFVACANLAGVQLSRALSRRREFAVRVALGAGRARIVRQVLSESVLLGLDGGFAGLLLATFALTVMQGLASSSLPSHARLSLDGGAIAAAAFVALLAGFAFGAAPALAIAATDPQATLREETRGASETRRSRTLRGVLVACQLALCISLLAGAGLLGRSLWAMSSAPRVRDAASTRGLLRFVHRTPAIASGRDRRGAGHRVTDRNPATDVTCRGWHGAGRSGGAVRALYRRVRRLFSLAAHPARARPNFRRARCHGCAADGSHQRKRRATLLARRQRRWLTYANWTRPQLAPHRGRGSRRRRAQRPRPSRFGTDGVRVDACERPVPVVV